MLQGITDYLQLLCWHTVFGSALRASFTAFQLRKTGSFDRMLCMKLTISGWGPVSPEQVQSPHFASIYVSVLLVSPVPVNISSVPKDTVSFTGMFTVLIWCLFALRGYSPWTQSSRWWNQWDSSTDFIELLRFFPLQFCVIKIEIIISSYCSQDRNGLPKQSPGIFNCSVLFQRIKINLAYVQIDK